MMQGQMPIVHARRPIGEDTGHLGGIDNAKCEIYVRPLVFLFDRARTRDRGATDARVARGVFKQN
jgi:hypothetical protein